jgi:hypothetical protein
MASNKKLLHTLVKMLDTLEDGASNKSDAIKFASAQHIDLLVALDLASRDNSMLRITEKGRALLACMRFRCM